MIAGHRSLRGGRDIYYRIRMWLGVVMFRLDMVSNPCGKEKVKMLFADR